MANLHMTTNTSNGNGFESESQVTFDLSRASATQKLHDMLAQHRSLGYTGEWDKPMRGGARIVLQSPDGNVGVVIAVTNLEDSPENDDCASTEIVVEVNGMLTSLIRDGEQIF